MKQLLFKYFFLVVLFGLFINKHVFSQNSVLVNVGSVECAKPELPTLTLIKDPLTASPETYGNCDLTAQLPNYYFVFVAYNPSDNKIYINDTRNFIYSKLWRLDIGLPGDLTCPIEIPTDPTYILNYTVNNFEFDNSGKLWAIRNYDHDLGQCLIERFELTTGSLLASKLLQFPVDHFPSDISSGDLAILPNGRFFATLGSNPSQLYEITNYNSGSGDATATFLQTMPSNTFGIAYLNGQMEITGTNSVDSCYYFDYNISANTLGEKKPFQNGQSPIDNTSISPALGLTKNLSNITKINNTTADIVYELFVANIGNAILQNINVTDNLEEVYGVGNVSNVSVNFLPGYNVHGLTLNAGYNGTSDINLLDAGQTLPNQTTAVRNNLFKLRISFRATNLLPNTIYYNTAIATGTIGNGPSLIIATDSSNNGLAAVLDLNNNNNANEAGENIPTPLDWNTILLPVNFINVNANLQNNNTAIVKWMISAPATNANKFEIEYSSDGINWKLLNEIKISDIHQTNYQIEHNGIPPGNVYYRIKQIDNNGYFIYSKIVMLNNNVKNNFTVYPNPANNYIRIDKGYSENKNITIELLNAVGQKLLTKKILSSSEDIQTTNLPNGTYLLKLMGDYAVKTYKIVIKH